VESGGALQLIWRLGRFLVVMIVLGFGFYFASPYLLAMVGQYLVTEQPLARTDLVLVLSGQVPLRVPEAARLYHDRYAPKILLTNELKERGLETYCA
jgi:hypothetical protein